MNKIFKLCLCLMIWSGLSVAQASPVIPIEHFSKDFAYRNVKISPDGKYLAFISKVDGKNNLYVLDIKKSKIISGVNFSENAQVGRYEWSGDDRLVMEKQYLRGWQSFPKYYGELFAMNADGSRKRYLVGYKGEMQTGSAVRKATPLYGTSFILDPLEHDEDHILIVTRPWNNVKEPKTVVYEVNVNTGYRKRVAGSPHKSGWFLTDRQGNVRVVSSTENYVDFEFFVRAPEGGEWQPLKLKNNALRNIIPVAFSASGKDVFLSASENGQPEGLYKLDLATGKTSLIFQDDVVSPTSVWVDPTSKEVYAVELEAGYPSYAFIDGDSKSSIKLKSLLAALPNSQVHIFSSSRDGKHSVVYAYSDTDPGQYYLYSEKEKSLKFLFSERGWIKPQEMSATKPIAFKARDGMTIHGYLTSPKGKAAKNLPLVVMPHGGPHGPRDFWGFNADTQLLASRGIAVLTVNFRGSGGYGKSFERAGHQKWGREIQFDIIDGTKYVVEQGYVNPENMCIMGASFGGYSALQSSILAPELFKCAIGVVGVYDLPLMFEEGDISEHETGRTYLTQVLGSDPKVHKAFSPSYNADKLKAKVLIVHGGEDRRAPIEQAESLIEALKEADHPYEYMLLESEGHGFYKAQHRQEYYDTVLTFLNKNLKL
ncbi:MULTISPECIES: S9 family peptidase [Pseudoalteromonas]|uniref:Peptidase S9 n=1 Tax=Pseudoalteromonas amylolytica TaxID=1859457 RepID=A0A1S1N0F7_9GAMM|nr:MULTISPECIES: S9 family peptidase [Pseudoalteromonas]OHU91797.1 peptidase S9 [Pseudoalteromonas sp. JW3]OHU93123.1 peptidase S9 [Pseudoalteromonas amylolytica]